MRSSLVAILLVLTSAAALAQQAGETIGHPPPLPGPPPIAEPSKETKPQTTAPPSAQAPPAKQGYIGAYGPSGAADLPERLTDLRRALGLLMRPREGSVVKIRRAN